MIIIIVVNFEALTDAPFTSGVRGSYSKLRTALIPLRLMARVRSTRVVNWGGIELKRKKLD